MKKIKYHFAIIFSAITWMIAVCGCGNSHSNENENAPRQYCLTDSLMNKISIDTVKSEAVMSELILSGKITFYEDKVVKVFPLASGHVKEVNVSLGDYVSEGQVLAVINSSDMAGYYNDFVTAKSNLAIAKKNMDAVEDMYKSGLSSEKEYITAQKEYQKAESEVNKVNLILKIYGGTGNPDELSGSGYVIKSPITGFVVEKNVTMGMEIRPDEGANLFTISDLKEVWAVANLYELDISKVQTDYAAEISSISYPDKIFTGKVDKISNMIDPETKVLSVKIRLTNPDYLLKPGMFARITIRYPENRTMLSVPRNSIVFDDNKNFVVKYNGQCDMKAQAIAIYKPLGNKVYIESDTSGAGAGLKEGDKIITQYGLFVFSALKKL